MIYVRDEHGLVLVVCNETEKQEALAFVGTRRGEELSGATF